MIRVEYKKRFLDGHLKGLSIIEAIYTDFPQFYIPGKIYESIEGNTIQIEQSIWETIW